MDIQSKGPQPLPLQEQSGLGAGKKLTPLEEQQFKRKLNETDLNELRAKMTTEIRFKPEPYNLKEALKTPMRTVYDTNIQEPMAERSDIGMAEVMKAFIKMDDRAKEGKSMAARPIAKATQTVLKFFDIHRGRLSVNPSKRDKNEFKQLLYEKYKTSLNEPTNSVFKIRKVHIGTKDNNLKLETEYFFSNFKAELHRFTDKSNPTIKYCKLTSEGRMALRLFIDNVYDEYSNDPANKKNEVIAFFETMTSDPVSDDIRERTLSSLMMTKALDDDVKLEILLKLSCAEKILNNEIEVYLREEGAEGKYIKFFDGDDDHVIATSTRKVRELVLKALKSENENIKDFGELAIRSMEKIGSKENTNKEQFVTSNRSDLPLLVDYLEEDEFTPEIYKTIQRYIIDLIPEKKVSEVKLNSKQEALLDRVLDYEEKVIEDTLQYLTKNEVDENYFKNEIQRQYYLDVYDTLKQLHISEKIIDRCEKNQKGFNSTRVLKEMLKNGLGNIEEINKAIDKGLDNIFDRLLYKVTTTTDESEKLLPNIIKRMALENEADRLNKKDINDIFNWKNKYIRIAEGTSLDIMNKDDDESKKILLTNYATIFKAVGLTIPNGEDYEKNFDSPTPNEETKNKTISLLNKIYDEVNNE